MASDWLTAMCEIVMSNERRGIRLFFPRYDVMPVTMSWTDHAEYVCNKAYKKFWNSSKNKALTTNGYKRIVC